MQHQHRWPVIAGIGDDAAAWQPAPGHLALETTDLLIEEVHFSLRYASWYEVGWKAMAVNVSDIAAMGGQPAAAFVSLGLRATMADTDVGCLFEGLHDCASEFGALILGGDTVRSPVSTVVNVALFGQSLDASQAILRRNCARPGDAIGISGPLGASAGYLRLRELARPTSETLRMAHVRPQPRVATGQALLRAGARCAIDVSDGLVADLGKICEPSGVGATIWSDKLPLSSEIVACLADEALTLALRGGEDYELLACASSTVLEQAGLTVIGQIQSAPGMRIVDGTGNEVPLDSGGYDAFGPRPS